MKDARTVLDKTSIGNLILIGDGPLDAQIVGLTIGYNQRTSKDVSKGRVTLGNALEVIYLGESGKHFSDSETCTLDWRLTQGPPKPIQLDLHGRVLVQVANPSGRSNSRARIKLREDGEAIGGHLAIANYLRRTGNGDLDPLADAIADAHPGYKEQDGQLDIFESNS